MVVSEVFLAVGLVGLALLICLQAYLWRLRRRAVPIVDRTAHDALRRSEERYRSVVESTRDYAIFTTDLKGHVVDWYPGAAAVFGWQAEEIRGRPADTLFVPEDRAADVPALELATAAKEGMAPDVRWHLRKDGQRVFIDGKVMPLTGPAGSEGFIKIGQDVTTRRRAERALRLSEERFSRFADASSDVLWVCDAATLRLDYASRAFTEVYGMDPAMVMRAGVRSWLRLIHPQDRASALDGVREVRDGRRHSADLRVRQPDGSFRWVRNTAFPLVDETGEVRQVGGIGADITVEKTASNRQEVLVRELQHRTRNVIAVVQALSDSTARETQSVSEFREAFANRLAALSRVQGLLSRLVEDEKITIDELLRSELDAHGALELGERVTLEGPVGIALRSRNVQTFALALHELATNAVKHGALRASGGRLAVRWWLEHRGGKRLLHIDWRETGVQMAPGAVRSGYGRELIERALPYQLDARTNFTPGPDGVHCTITVPLTED
jgi:PAS domain S-box-containing protein